MAGDWIKVEHATIDKPEVLRMAELLGIKRREMLGLLVDFFVWLDRNSRHGSVTHMSRMSLDEVTNMAGFSAALCAVGWATIDDSTGIMTVKNWDRHNGNSAKSRALAKDRKANERSRKGHAGTVTREEKRRGLSIPSGIESGGAPPTPDDDSRGLANPREGSPKPAGKKPLPAMPTDEHREIAASRKVDCDFEWAKYCDWKRTKGVTHKNPEAGFRNWLRRAEPPPVRRQTREEIARAMFGGLINGTDPSADPKDITGESTRLT